MTGGWVVLWCVGCCTLACTPDDNYLGYEKTRTVAPALPSTGRADAGPMTGAPVVSAPTPVDDEPDDDDERDAGTSVPQPDDSEVDAGGPTAPAIPDEPDTSIEDPGDDDPELDAGMTTLPTESELPNHFVDALGVPEDVVADRIEGDFQQLFHGNPDTQSIYYEVGEDQAYVYDVFHDDTRLDAVGYGMLITVSLDRRTEFDKIWNFTKSNLQYTSGPNQGYFYSTCPVSATDCPDDVGVYGFSYIVTGLLLAEKRWGNGEDVYDYGAQARALLDVARNKEAQNGIVDDVTNIFDAEAMLPVRNPTVSTSEQVSPGSVMPAFFEFWGEQTGDAFWTETAQRSREYLHLALHADTGLAPNATGFDGSVVAGEEQFKEPSYTVGFSIAMDYAWHGRDTGQVDLANRLIGFFAGFGGSYPSYYLYTGEPQSQNPSGALAALTGATAGIATAQERVAFIRTVWDTPLQEGLFRYFDGVTQFLALMYLAGYITP